MFYATYQVKTLKRLVTFQYSEHGSDAVYITLYKNSSEHFNVELQEHKFNQHCIKGIVLNHLIKQRCDRCILG